MPAGRAHIFSEMRSGLPRELANLYLAVSADRVSGATGRAGQDAIAFALGRQLASWAHTNAPSQAPLFESVLAPRSARLSQDGRLAQIRSRLQPVSGDYFARLEERLDSAIDERTKTGLLFRLAAYRIHSADFQRARTLVEELASELRRPLMDILDLKRTSAAIASGDLGAARRSLAALRADLHRVLAALSRAYAYGDPSTDAGSPAAEVDGAAVEFVQLARGAPEAVIESVRPHARLAIARVLAFTGRSEEPLLALELASQALNAARPPNERPGQTLSVSVSARGEVASQITHGGLRRYFHLPPPNAPGASFEDVVRRLSMSADPDLDRLEAIAARAVDPRLRTLGLVAVAEGPLARAFQPKDPGPRRLSTEGRSGSSYR